MVLLDLKQYIHTLVSGLHGCIFSFLQPYNPETIQRKGILLLKTHHHSTTVIEQLLNFILV
jgi:hypothetical protein